MKEGSSKRWLKIDIQNNHQTREGKLLCPILLGVNLEWDTVAYLPLSDGYFVCLILAVVFMRKEKEICVCRSQKCGHIKHPLGTCSWWHNPSVVYTATQNLCGYVGLDS